MIEEDSTVVLMRQAGTLANKHDFATIPSYYMSLQVVVNFSTVLRGTSTVFFSSTMK